MSLPATPAAALAEARQRIPVSEARILLTHVLGRDRAWLEAHRDDPLAEDAASRFVTLAARRASGEPVAYLVGRREFHGRDFVVTPAVLIPRPETELLVDWALEKAGRWTAPRILDLGTGSGCIAITLALALPEAEVTAVDLAPEALAVARRNADRLGARVEFRLGDWFDAVGDARFDLVVANPPYVAAGDPHLHQGDLPFEPRHALESGPDGLDAIRRIARQAICHMGESAWLACEHGFDQGHSCREIFEALGFEDVVGMRALAGHPRITAGTVTKVTLFGAT